MICIIGILRLRKGYVNMNYLIMHNGLKIPQLGTGTNTFSKEGNQFNGEIAYDMKELSSAIQSGITIDHIIPLSTNVLNKDLRRMKSEEKGKKVQSESYGSNHYDNLIIACKNCNNHKKHRLLTKDNMCELLTRKQSTKLNS